MKTKQEVNSDQYLLRNMSPAIFYAEEWKEKSGNKEATCDKFPKNNHMQCFE